MSHYVRDGHESRRTDPVTWHEWVISADRVVARTQVSADLVVSTVFVGLDMGCDPSSPLLFETELMKAGVSSVDARRVRYSTWAEAEVGHEEIVREYRGF
ncbi:hypothetical protein IC762_30785 [Bradyrhizobium genosp. L]|uniref:hypothetical protein n=1 Tax=Bradyrhizobium genosp. L TaxID=83637 RepID=UPI0018A3222A|nr:hypothetical protein [Bradyrhizobium genosp. L]QPF83982.1 hypothetical protein IC762_30785 [Bradyrhizobium genosp. L]